MSQTPSSIAPWQRPPETLSLEHDEVQVWFAALQQAAPTIPPREDILSDEERSRARRFHFDRDRQRFIARRAVLRLLLARYTGRDPGQLEFFLDPGGKPRLACPTGADPIQFSLSHSQAGALYGFARGRRIGVDLEFMHPLTEMEQIVSRYFSAREDEAFRGLPRTLRQEAFYRYWTAKEAFLKALGDGLSRGLDQFDIALEPDSCLSLQAVRWDPSLAAHWSLEGLRPAPGFAAALAVEGNALRLSCFGWPPGP